MTLHNGARLALAAGAFALAAACSGGDGPGNPGPKGGDDRVPTSLRLSPSTVSLADGDSARLTATVYDQNGTAYAAPPASAPLTWTSTDASVVYVSGGLLRGLHRGQVWVYVQAGALKDSAQVTVRPVPTALLAVRGDGQTAAVGTALPDSVAVRVVDRNGEGVGGVAVSFAVTAGGGSAAPPSAQTDSAGFAKTAWRLGAATGANALEARATGLSGSPRAFAARATAGPAARVAAVSGGGQTAAVGTALPQPLVVRVTDAGGNAAAGAAVTWIVATGGGTLAGSASTADSAGLAQVAWTLGTTAGGNHVRVLAAGDTAGFDATAAAGPAVRVRMTPDSADRQVGDTVRYAAQAVDQYGNAATPPGPVTWYVTGTAVARVSTTGLVTALAGGKTHVLANMAPLVGDAVITVRAPAAVVVTPALDTLTSVGDTVRLGAAVKDAAGNPYAGATVVWSTTDTGVVAVSATGLVTAKRTGPAYVIARVSGGTAADTAFIVVDQRPASLRMTVDSLSLPVGTGHYFIAWFYDARGNRITATLANAATWSVGNSALATTVPSNGFGDGSSAVTISARAVGSTTVRASYGSLSATVPVRVIADPVSARMASQYGSSVVVGPSGSVYRISGDTYTQYVTSNTPTGSQRWSFQVPACSGARACLAVDDSENVYVRSGTAIVSMTGATGNLRWSTPLPVGTGNMSLSGAGQLFVQAGKVLYALNASTGAVQWQHDLGNPGRALLYDRARGVLYVGLDAYLCNNCVNTTPNVLAVDPATGATRWSVVLTTTVDGPFALAADGTVYAQGHNGYPGRISAVSPAGALLWTASPNVGSNAEISPVVDGAGHVIWAGATAVVALSASGAELWRWQPVVAGFGTSLQYLTPVVDADGVVYVEVSGSSGGITGIAAIRNGVELWTHTKAGWSTGSAEMSGTGHMVLGRDGKLYVNNGYQLVVMSTGGYPAGVQWPMAGRDPGGQFHD